MRNIITVLTLLFISNITYSAPIKFNFIFVENGGSAKTVGYIVYENTLLSNPGDNSFNIPNAAILDLYAVVTGTTGGDGVFTLNDFDFNRVIFNTGGVALDFTRELVGQPTDAAPWGTIVQDKTTYVSQGGRGADFNLLSNGQQPPAKNTNTSKGMNLPPSAFSAFILQAASGELMAIASFSANVPIIPTLSNYSLVAITLLLMLFGFYNLRKFKLNQ